MVKIDDYIRRYFRRPTWNCLAVPVISLLMPLSVSFLETKGLRWHGGSACARGLIRRRLFLIFAAAVSLGIHQ